MLRTLWSRRPWEGKARLGAADDLGLLYLVILLKPEPSYLVLQELMHALSDRLHRLAGEGSPEALLRRGDQEVLGNRPGLDATTATVQDLVAVRLGEKR
jgi:hypothetical protein